MLKQFETEWPEERECNNSTITYAMNHLGIWDSAEWDALEYDYSL